MPHQPRITSHESRVKTLRTTLRHAIAQLESEHIPSAPLAAELLLMHTLGRDRTWLYAHSEQELDAATRERYFSLITRRASGVPTQHLTGHQEFWGLDFEVTPDVLIPRPETEHVIEVTLERLAIPAGSAASQRNATRHGVAPRIDFIECNLLGKVLYRSPATSHQSPPYDLIASNPPYIGRNEAATLPREVREHEPDSALFGGETGTEMYAPLIEQAATLLKRDGILVLELGHNSAEHVSSLLTAPAWSDLSLTKDLAGIERVASARRTSTY